MVTETLVAIAAGQRMGQLEHAGARVSFTYDPAWRTARGAYPLSLSMPLEVERHTARALVPFLWGLLPDNRDVLEQWGRRFGVSPRNPFRLLGHVGEDCAGGVQFVKPEREEHLLARPAPPPEWLTKRQVAERLRELRRNASAGRLASDKGQFSLPGAQRKTALVWGGRQWGVPEGATPTSHILKPTLTAFDGHAENEHICLELARELGIPAAHSWVEQFEDQVVIVVERFDRVREGAEAWLRVHQEDLCQACGVHPERKYENQGGPGAVQIIRVLRDCSSAAEEDVATFVRALALHWLIGGTDAHAKNYSVLFGGGSRVRLAPLYDVASALPYYPSERQDLTLAMRIGGEYEMLRIGPHHWDRLSDEIGLPRKAVADILRQLCSALPSAYEKVHHAAARAGLTHPILDALRTHLQRRVAEASPGLGG